MVLKLQPLLSYGRWDPCVGVSSIFPFSFFPFLSLVRISPACISLSVSLPSISILRGAGSAQNSSLEVRWILFLTFCILYFSPLFWTKITSVTVACHVGCQPIALSTNHNFSIWVRVLVEKKNKFVHFWQINGLDEFSLGFVETNYLEFHLVLLSNVGDASSNRTRKLSTTPCSYPALPL